MSLILRLRQHFQTGIFPELYVASAIRAKPIYPNLRACRNYGQPAIKEEEEFDIDPRKLPADYDPAKFDPTCHRSQPSDPLFRLIDEVSSLTVREAAELASVLMRKMDMSEPPVIGVLKVGETLGLGQIGANASSVDAQEEKAEKTVLGLKLESFDATSKIKVIKEIMAFTNLRLKEANALVEKTPSVFKTGVSKEEAEQVIDKMKAVGAVVVME